MLTRTLISGTQEETYAWWQRVIVRDAMIHSVDMVGVLHSFWVGNTSKRRGNILPTSPTLVIFRRWRYLNNSIQRCITIWFAKSGTGKRVSEQMTPTI
jgi:hypothetical protein